MRGLLEPFVPVAWPWATGNGKPAPTKPPASVREQARTAGRLLLEEDEVLGQLAPLRGRATRGPERRRLERRLLGVRGMRLKIEKLLQENASRR